MRSSFTPSSIGLAIYVKALPDKSYADIEGHFDVFEIIAPERTELLKEVERLYGVQVPDIARIVVPKEIRQTEYQLDCRIDFNELEEGKYIELDTAVEKMGDDVQLSAIELTTGENRQYRF